MARILLLAGLLLGVFHTQAEARTIRYEFDVVGSNVYYQSISNPSGGSLTPGSADYDAFVAAYHPLRDMIGQTGNITFEAEQDTSDFRGDFTCVSGFLCPAITSFHYVFASDTGFTALGHFEWYLDGNLRFFDDGNIGGWADLNGTDHLWWAPQAEFSLANLTITDVTGQTQIAAAPLPAAGWLYAALGLVLLARRRR